MSTFSERLKQLRIDRGLMQKELSAFLEITTFAYQRYEYGEREPDFDKINKLCDFYNVSADYLLGIGVYRDIQSVIKNRDLITDIICAEMPKAKFNGAVFFTMLSDFAFIRILSAYVSDIDFTDGIKIKYYYE